jgi:hypothetical protein
LGYCGKDSYWTIYSSAAGDVGDPCDYIARSSETETFEVETTSTDTWYTKYGKPVDFVKIICLSDGEASPKKNEPGPDDNESGSCKQVFHDTTTTTKTRTDALIFSDTNIFEVVQNHFSHNQPIYRAQIRKPVGSKESVDACNETKCDCGGGVYRCHTWFNALNDATEEQTVCIQNKTGEIWETDACGCCGGVCPVDLDVCQPQEGDGKGSSDVIKKRDWFQWAYAEANISTDEGWTDDGILAFISDNDVPNDDWYDDGISALLADNDVPNDNGTEAVATDGNSTDKETDENCCLSGLCAYLVFMGRRWMHMVTESKALCSSFHAFSLESSGITVTYVSEAIDLESNKRYSPDSLTWFLAHHDGEAFPHADTLRPIDTTFHCVEQLEWAELLPDSTIPSYLGKLRTIEALDLRGLGLQGSIPSEIGNIISLKSLDLRGNDLSGTLPSELGNLVSLHSLDLRGNDLSGTLPSELDNLVSLKSLDLRGNQLSGNLRSELGNLKSLGTSKRKPVVNLCLCVSLIQLSRTLLTMSNSFSIRNFAFGR